MEINEVEERPGPMPRPGEAKIPPNHTTLASNLTMWPAISKLIWDLGMRNGIRDSMHHEGDRGLIRLFGQGEGSEFRQTLTDHGTLADLDEASKSVYSPSPHGTEWGQIGGLSLASSGRSTSTQTSARRRSSSTRRASRLAYTTCTRSWHRTTWKLKYGHTREQKKAVAGGRIRSRCHTAKAGDAIPHHR